VKQTFSHPALPRFAELAECFCELVTSEQAHPAAQKLRELHDLLPRLYAAALDLPPITVLFDEGSHELDVELSGIQPRARSKDELVVPVSDELAGFLGSRRYYREVFDPYSGPEEVEVTGNLIDDFSDIVRDLEAGLDEWHAGNTGVALWNWRFTFESHWGEHATSALRALFALCAWHDLEWPAAGSLDDR